MKEINHDFVEFGRQSRNKQREEGAEHNLAQLLVLSQRHE